MEAEVPTVRVGATPTGLTTCPPPQPPFLPPNQQRLSTEGIYMSRKSSVILQLQNTTPTNAKAVHNIAEIQRYI